MTEWLHFHFSLSCIGSTVNCAKEMATHSSVLAWRIPGTEEPSGLPSVGSHRSDTTEATWQQQQHPLNINLFLNYKHLANTWDIRDVGAITGSGRFLEEGTATHSSLLAWRIPWMEQPVGLQSIESQRVGHGWSNLARTHTLQHRNIFVSIYFIDKLT